MATLPKVSVIMPVYNGERFLAKAIDSIVAQTFTEWELIIVDDGSTDNTAQLAATYAATDERIILLKKPVNEGMSAAKNEAIALSRAPYILFMDADDIALPTRIAQLYTCFMQDETLGLVSTARWLIDESDHIITEHWVYRWCDLYPLTFDKSTARALLFWICFAPPPMVRKCVLPTPAFDIQYKIGEDFKLWKHIAAQGYAVCNTQPITLHYRVHTQNATRNFDHARTTALLQQLFRHDFERIGLPYTVPELAIHTAICLGDYGLPNTGITLAEYMRWLQKVEHHYTVRLPKEAKAMQEVVAQLRKRITVLYTLRRIKNLFARSHQR